MAKGEIPVNVMLAAKYELKRIQQWPVAVEPKLDGVRTLMISRNTEAIQFASRNGNPFPSLNHMSEEVQAVIQEFGRQWDKIYGVNVAPFREVFTEGITFDGESTAGREFNEGAGIIRRLREDAAAVISVFDVQVGLPYNLRRELLEKTFENIDARGNVILIPQELASSENEIIDHYDRFRSQGYEGAMVKLMNGEYWFRRHWTWMKLKHTDTFDVRIIGIIEGEGKYVGMLGAFYCEVFDDATDLVCGYVKVGGGFSDQERADFWNSWPAMKDTYIEVEAQERTPDGSLRHPRFLKVRNDK